MAPKERGELGNATEADAVAPSMSTPDPSPTERPSTSTPPRASVELAKSLGRFAWPSAFVAIFAMGAHALAPAKAEAPGEAAHAIEVAPSDTVIEKLAALGKLETAALRLEKVVDVTDTQKHLFGLVEAEDTLLYVAKGEVVLGVDLGKVRPGDLRFDARTKTASLSLLLPEPEVFSTRLDELGSHVHARRTGLFAEKNLELEGVARKRALAAFEQAASDPKARELARSQAEAELRRLAKAFGATDVTVTFRDVATAERAP
jgi:hypothetical protein